jgi:hypothetical protein
MRFIKFGSKSIKAESIEAVTIYTDEVTIHTERNSYTVYYENTEIARQAYEQTVKELEGMKNEN